MGFLCSVILPYYFNCFYKNTIPFKTVFYHVRVFAAAFDLLTFKICFYRLFNVNVGRCTLDRAKCSAWIFRSISGVSVVNSAYIVIVQTYRSVTLTAAVVSSDDSSQAVPLELPSKVIGRRTCAVRNDKTDVFPFGSFALNAFAVKGSVQTAFFIEFIQPFVIDAIVKSLCYVNLAFGLYVLVGNRSENSFCMLIIAALVAAYVNNYAAYVF